MLVYGFLTEHSITIAPELPTMPLTKHLINGLALGLVVVAVSVAVVLRLRAWPHGAGADSIGIWLRRARPIARGGNAFDAELGPPRYPLLVPVLIAVQFSFNASRSRTVWAGFSTRWY